MQVKTSPTASVLDSVDAVAASEAFRPSRLNFAQVCRYCTTRWCQSPRCIDAHARSLWAACENCDGFGLWADCTSCAEGVVEHLPGEGFNAIVARPLPVSLPSEEEPAYFVTQGPPVAAVDDAAVQRVAELYGSDWADALISAVPSEEARR